MSAFIEIQMPHGTRKVSATKLTHLAVHRDATLSGWWTVTHLATGCSIAGATTEHDALECARTVERECPDELAAIANLKPREQIKKGSRRLAAQRKRLLAVLAPWRSA